MHKKTQLLSWRQTCWWSSSINACLSTCTSVAHGGVHPYEKCDYKRECEWASALPQLAWHLAWHIAARPRLLPALSNVAVYKPIKKPLLNALSLSLLHALQHRPLGAAATQRRCRQRESPENRWCQNGEICRQRIYMQIYCRCLFVRHNTDGCCVSKWANF